MYMLDTCAFIWMVQKDSRMSSSVLNILSGYDDVYVSQATLWEIAIKQTTGKINLTMTSFELEDKCREEKITVLPLECRYFERIKNSSPNTQRPF